MINFCKLLQFKTAEFKNVVIVPRHIYCTVVVNATDINQDLAGNIWWKSRFSSTEFNYIYQHQCRPESLSIITILSVLKDFWRTHVSSFRKRSALKPARSHCSLSATLLQYLLFHLLFNSFLFSLILPTLCLILFTLLAYLQTNSPPLWHHTLAHLSQLIDFRWLIFKYWVPKRLLDSVWSVCKWWIFAKCQHELLKMCCENL